jgi:hypothetical protein
MQHTRKRQKVVRPFYAPMEPWRNSIRCDGSGFVICVASTPYTASYELCCSSYSLTVDLAAADGICSDIEGRPCLWEHERCR